jgi:hypothetical protein
MANILGSSTTVGGVFRGERPSFSADASIVKTACLGRL